MRKEQRKIKEKHRKENAEQEEEPESSETEDMFSEGEDRKEEVLKHHQQIPPRKQFEVSQSEKERSLKVPNLPNSAKLKSSR